MNSFNHLHTDLIKNFKLREPRERRGLVIDQMTKLETQGIHCRNCSGTCCTSVANSMQITPLETLEILINLEAELSSESSKKKLIDHLTQTVQLYRLDKEIYTGKKNQESLRKRYTCPFFNNGTPGCSLSRSYKPYGCLGFNAMTENDNGQSCRSDFDLLEKRDQLNSEAETLSNAYLKQKWNLHWDKKSIPEALLELIALTNTDEQ